MPPRPKPKGDVELAARLRAAFAFADLTKAERAAALGVSVRTVGRYESAELDLPRDLWPAVCEVTGVPEWFLRHGWEPPAVDQNDPLEQRVAALEQMAAGRIARLERQMVQLATMVRQRAGDAPARPADELLQPPADHAPRRPSGRDAASRQAAGARGGSVRS
ncbi:MAG: helix-turn-helix transcriptional regulator [Steroidobacteraceae bacterium]|nr:helix-turn-helix transcriptional regulator [Steroidobacteraceae bacterium]